MEPSTYMEQGSSSNSHGRQEQIGLPKWNPKHKVFLSHSGKQKEFVRQLYKDLKAEILEPFFDEESSSLPMGEPFAPFIFAAARQCLVAVIVLSEDFLTSKWPMLELVEFVRAKKSHNPDLKLLPLFYKLSPKDLKKESIENRWMAAWAEFITQAPDQVISLDDSHRQLNLSSCIEALCELQGANGLKFEKPTSKVAYREAIVKEISLLVAPDLLDDTSDVIGNERLCEVIHGMFVKDIIKDSNLLGTSKLGLFGMGGLGKTTMCRALCMFFCKHFNGRVFHVELGSRPPLDLQKLVLIELLRINKDVAERVYTVHQGRKLLKAHMNRQPVFLAIDNITNDHDSQLQASALEAGFHHGSMVMITSRSLDVVEKLFPNHQNAIYCKALAMLSEEEARLIFLQRAAPQRKLDTLTIQEQQILKKCVSQCHFLLDNRTRQYHPLALQALADYYREQDNSNMLKWEEHLEDLDKFKHSNALSKILGVLGLQFTTLSLKERLLFLDLCLYIDPNLLLVYSTKGLSWLVDVHEDTSTTVRFQLQSLKRSGIINIPLYKGDEFISIHDLYREFAKWYVIDGEGSHCPELGCIYHNVSTNSLRYVLMKRSPSSSQLQRIYLQNLECVTFPSKKVQEWCNVVVLQIHDCSNLEVLDLHGLSCLRHLELRRLYKLVSFHFADSQADSNKGSNGMLESLQHVVLIGLFSLEQVPDFSLCPSLKTFRMLKSGEFLLEPPRFMGCSQLQDVNLDWNLEWRVEELKLDTLTSLTLLHVRNRTLKGASKWSTISTLEAVNFLTLTGLGNCSGLQSLKLLALPITSLIGLEKLTKLQELGVSHCESLQYIPDVSPLADLTSLLMCRLPFQHIPGVERLLKLKCLSFTACTRLTSFPDLDHLPKLTCVELGYCRSLQVKPQLPIDSKFSFYHCIQPLIHLAH